MAQADPCVVLAFAVSIFTCPRVLLAEPTHCFPQALLSFPLGSHYGPALLNAAWVLIRPHFSPLVLHMVSHCLDALVLCLCLGTRTFFNILAK